MEETQVGQEGVSFVIPSCPPSVNSLYQVIFSLKRIELKKECLLWKSKSKQYMPPFQSIGTSTTGLLRMECTFYYSMYHKNGKLKKVDSSNMIKLLQDAISERYGIDDKFVTSGSWQSVDSNTERTEVKLHVV